MYHVYCITLSHLLVTYFHPTSSSNLERWDHGVTWLYQTKPQNTTKCGCLKMGCTAVPQNCKRTHLETCDHLGTLVFSCVSLEILQTNTSIGFTFWLLTLARLAIWVHLKIGYSFPSTKIIVHLFSLFKGPQQRGSIAHV